MAKKEKESKRHHMNFASAYSWSAPLEPALSIPFDLLAIQLEQTPALTVVRVVLRGLI